MTPSVSARIKWGKFFPAFDMAVEFAAARRPGKLARRQIRKQCPCWGSRTFAERGTFWLVSPARAVFVVTPDDFVVDVFPLESDE